MYADAPDQPWVDYTEPDAAGNFVAFRCPAGDGTYPVWIGRTAAGEVACFVAEPELLRDAPVVPA